MIKKIVLLLIACLTINFIFGQEESLEIKRLIQSLEVISENAQKVDTLNEISFQYLYEDLDLARQYALQADTLAKRINYRTGIATSLLRIGLVEMFLDEYEKSEQYFIKALKLRIQIGEPRGIARVYNNLGYLLDEAGKPLHAMDYYYSGLEVLNSIKDISDQKPLSSQIARMHNNYGSACKEAGKFNLAEYHYEKSIQLREELKDSVKLAKSYMNLGSLYYQEEFMDTAKSREYLTKSLDIFILNNRKKEQTKCLINFGNLFFHQNKYKEAMAYYAIAKKEKDYVSPSDLVIIARNEGSVYHEKQEYKKALRVYEESLESYQDTDDLTEIAYLYNDMGNVFFDMGDFKKANTHLNKSLVIADKNKLSGLKTLVLSSIKNVKERELLKKDLERKSLISNGIIGFASFVIITLFFFHLTRKKRQLAEQKVLLAKKDIDVLISNQALKTTSARLDGIEEERKRIAAALHDKIGVMLSTAKLYFAPMDQQLANLDLKQKDKYEKANKILDEAYEEVRRISHNMASPSLTSLGLVGELELLANRIKSAKQLNIQVIAHEMNERLDNQLEMQLYQVIQELITNILKHANASEVNIELNHFEDFINVMVQDNGIGFEYNNTQQSSNGMGLDNIHKTIEQLKGTIIIDSKISSGTTISIDIPI